MQERIKYFETSPEAMNIMLSMEQYIANCHKNKKTLDYKLIELIKMRVSQINGCAYCLDMHSKDAVKNQETQQRLYTLSAWKETPFFTEKERAALAWAEALTNLSGNDVDEQLYQNTRLYFNEEQIVDLTFVINAINAWNRYAVSFKTVVGSYNPQ